MKINVLESVEAMRQWRHAHSSSKLAFVPTMGALHDGHLSLVEKARTYADTTVVSIFVNPLQFGPTEDYDRYPRSLEEDIKRLESVDSEVKVFLPSAKELYPEGFCTTVTQPETLINVACGKSRPTHFSGVLTVVAKLFQIVAPDLAIFGKKDYQQLFLIRRMVHDLDMPIEVVGGDTIREQDGLALSSRNMYLDEGARQRASKLPKALSMISKMYEEGERNILKLRESFADAIEGDLEYLEFRDRQTFIAFDSDVPGNAVALAAVRIGNVRLIDNIELG